MFYANDLKTFSFFELETALRFVRAQELLTSIILCITLVLPMNLSGQSKNSATDFPELTMTKIPGAPVLSKPTLLTNTNNIPLISEGYGTCAPAYWDWDGDGLKDLLIGEFGSGIDLGRYMGNFIRVYLNTGTEKQPEFTGDFNYAWPPYKIVTNGTPYSVSQFCCVGFTPQFIDLNNDGYTDLTSGQYFGEVIVFRGTKNGFLGGEPLIQEGDPRDRPTNYAEHQKYWLYSSASFGDLTADKIPDMVVGGEAIRLSRNIGTSTSPQFAHREFLLDVNEHPLKVYEYTKEEIAHTFELYTAGDYKVSPVVVDWDNDGVLDLLVTNSYNRNGMAAIDFFKGRKIGIAHRFESGVPLFTPKDGKKALPGISPFVSVTDWNHDGVNDLLIGVSVVTINNTFNPEFSWNWEKDLGLQGITKDPGLIRGKNMEATLQWILKEVNLPQNVTKEDFMTMRHQGYVYVMLGTIEENKVEKNRTGK